MNKQDDMQLLILGQLAQINASLKLIAAAALAKSYDELVDQCDADIWAESTRAESWHAYAELAADKEKSDVFESLYSLQEQADRDLSDHEKEEIELAMAADKQDGREVR